MIKIVNNPMDILSQAINNLYPDKMFKIIINGELKDEDGNEVFGITYLDEELCKIEISAQLSIFNFTEVVAHEIAHAVIGETEDDDTGHGKKWGKEFDRIYKEYVRLVSKKEGKNK